MELRGNNVIAVFNSVNAVEHGRMVLIGWEKGKSTG
jgi:hypothetical protein